MLKVLHNNSCSKSRSLVHYLTEKGVDFEIRNIIESPLSEVELLGILDKGIEIHDLARTSDKFFQENFSENLSEKEMIHILSQNPRLIQRPIIIKGEKAIIARPIELAQEFVED